MSIDATEVSTLVNWNKIKLAMNFTIGLKNIRYIEKIEGYWKNEDYRKLLELFDFADAKDTPDTELYDMLLMAITDFEPDEAAEIILTYKLDTVLNKGQLKNLSHEMLEDKVAEEHADISLHYPLFNINRLLYEAYNGKFPKTLASVIDFELNFGGEIAVTKEIVLRTLSDLLSERSLLKRLFDEQLDSEIELKDAEYIIWELRPLGEHAFQLITSDYWINKEDFEKDQHKGELGEEELSHKK